MRSVILIILIGIFGTAESWAIRVRSGPNPEKVNELKAAAPLNHTVRVSRTGRILKLDYELIGSDGKTYSLWDISDRSKPTFSIYQNDVKVGGGTFEFG